MSSAVLRLSGMAAICKVTASSRFSRSTTISSVRRIAEAFAGRASVAADSERASEALDSLGDAVGGYVVFPSCEAQSS
jgi:hypothetical protein